MGALSKQKNSITTEKQKWQKKYRRIKPRHGTKTRWERVKKVPMK